MVEAEAAAPSGSPGHALAQGGDELADSRSNVAFPVEVRADEANAARDVEPDATGRHHPSVLHVGSRDAADGKPVPPVDVGHRVGGLDDAWQSGHVCHLLDRSVLHGLVHQALGCEDHDAIPNSGKFSARSGAHRGPGHGNWPKLLTGHSLAWNLSDEMAITMGGKIVPLLDHFHAPLDERYPWESFHSGWATRIWS